MKITAFAKINLYLRVLGKRPDGYHEINTVMQSVSLCDEIILTPQRKDGITFFCDAKELSNRDNIAVKACELFLDELGKRDGFKIELKKRIPTAAGLGGGSSDAAAIICGLNKYYNEPFSCEKLTQIAARIGADVPFFINGGCAFAKGIGEKLTLAEKCGKQYYVLVKSGEKASTGKMYAELDRCAVSHDEAVPFTLENFNSLCDLSQNDFEKVYKGDERLRKKMISLGAKTVMLCGSGPTLFAAFSSEADAKAAYYSLSKEYDDCFFATDTDCGNMIE